jgi:hypothetical protein
LTRELHAGPAVSISNDIDVNEFEQEEAEEEEDGLSDAVSSSTGEEESDDDDMAPPVPVRAMPTRVPIKVHHAMPTQGRLIHDLAEDDTPYDSWGRISEGQWCGPPPPYTATELR